MKISHLRPDCEDARGTITDLIAGEDIDAVTIVRTKAGSIRGNHYHAETRQWAHVVSGKMLVSDGKVVTLVGPGSTILDEPGEPHAWRAVEDTVCVVFVQGPRAGEDYESDTYRLEEPILLP